VRYMMLHKMSANYVINSYQWTVEQVRAVIERKWRIKISGARLYQLFEQWGLSLQKVSHDCGHAEAQAQAPFYRGLKKTAQISDCTGQVCFTECVLYVLSLS
jgi:winged helix-turn-helix protein